MAMTKKTSTKTTQPAETTTPKAETKAPAKKAAASAKASAAKKVTKKAAGEVVAGERDPESVASYLGHMKYFVAGKMVAELFEGAGWVYRH